MSILVAYEIHRFQAGFDYNFNRIKNLQTFKWADQKGYIKDKNDRHLFKNLFTEKIKSFCHNYNFGNLIIEPRGLKIPVPFLYREEGIRYQYENGNLIIQDDSMEYTFKHDNDSLNLISSIKSTQKLNIKKWSQSGNIGTSLYAQMYVNAEEHITKKFKHYGFMIFPASIGCYRKIILKYTQYRSMFYGFTFMATPPYEHSHQIYFFYGYLPQKNSNEEDFSLQEFFLLHEMIYYKNYKSIFPIWLLHLLSTSRINQITSKKPYLKHITDTLMPNFGNGPYGYYLKRCLYLFTFCFIIRMSRRYPFKSIFLMFLSAYTFFFSKKYTDLYMWCGLQ